jgi:hypothetical protein
LSNQLFIPLDNGPRNLLQRDPLLRTTWLLVRSLNYSLGRCVGIATAIFSAWAIDKAWDLNSFKEFACASNEFLLWEEEEEEAVQALQARMRKSLFVVDTSNGLGEGGVVTVKNEDVVSGQDTACADTMVFIN